MSGAVGAGCKIMRCAYWDGSACAYPGERCRYNAVRDNEGRPSIKLHDTVDAGFASMHGEFAIKLKLALDALGAISDKYHEFPNDREESAPAMRDIADSALRRLSLNRPDA